VERQKCSFAVRCSRTLRLGVPTSVVRQSIVFVTRTVLGDRVILKNPMKQIVLLGAGLDTRAHRMNLGPDCQFYEIDIPPTQELKKAIASRHNKKFKGNVVYVPVDFSKESFMDKLLSAEKFEVNCAETIVFFVGVTYYLEWEEVKKTMVLVTDTLADGTLLCLDIFDDSVRGGKNRLAKVVTSFGEPFK
jgi:methyltransferase (TIGR00027 family)